MKNYLNKLFYRHKNHIATINKDELNVWESNIIDFVITKDEIPRVIWSYWHEGKLPESVKICIESWKKNNLTYKIYFLNKDSIFEFLPDFKFEDYYIENPVFYCDLIRLLLLDKYGGIYLDSSVFLNQSLNEYLNCVNNNNLDLLCFSTGGHNNDNKFPITESWFLISNFNNSFLKIWFNVLDSAFRNNNPQNYFEKNYQEAYLSVNQERRDYYFIYMASQVALREVVDIKIGFLDSTVNGFYYNYKFKFNYDKIAKYLLLDKSYNEFPSVIKLINKNRVSIDKYIMKKLYKKNSMFGKYIR